MTDTELMTIKSWGFKKQQFDIKELNIYHRPGTSDEKIINEVLIRNVYQKLKLKFLVETDDTWLDIGCNIATFALLALSAGGNCICVEPEPRNLEMMRLNLEQNFPNTEGHRYVILPYAVNDDAGELDLYLCKGEYNHSRHTLYQKRGRASIKVKTVTLEDILDEYPEVDAIKIDCEGSEVPILEKINWNNYKNIKKLVFEMSFDIYPSIPRFLAIVDKLRQHFEIVHYTKVDESALEYKFYPPCTNVYAIGRIDI